MKDYQTELDILVDKVEGVTDKNWVEVVDELGLEVHPDSLRKSFTGGRYCGYQVYKYFQEKLESGYTEEESTRLEDLRRELYKEKCRVQDQKREYSKLLRESARYEHIVDRMEQAIEKIEPLALKTTHNSNPTSVEAVLILSDFHYGLEIDNVLNEYNVDIAKERLEALLKKTIYYCQIHRVQKLRLGLAGDLICGAIHLQSRVAAEEDLISQVINVSELLANFINQLKGYIPDVKVHGVIGNHSRINADKKSNMPAENFERLIFKYIELRVPSVKVCTNGLEDWITFNVKDQMAFLTHGDKDSLTNIRIHAVNLLGKVPDRIYFGHIHHLNIKDDNGTEIVVNGSICSTDEYAMGLRVHTKPYQILQVFDKDTCTYKLEL